MAGFSAAAMQLPSLLSMTFQDIFQSFCKHFLLLKTSLAAQYIPESKNTRQRHACLNKERLAPVCHNGCSNLTVEQREHQGAQI